MSEPTDTGGEAVMRERDAMKAENARLREAITDMLDGYEDYDFSSGKAVRCPPDRQTSWCRRARAALEAK